MFQPMGSIGSRFSEHVLVGLAAIVAPNYMVEE